MVQNASRPVKGPSDRGVNITDGTRGRNGTSRLSISAEEATPSLQYHHHREEWWLVEGEAEATTGQGKDSKTIELKKVKSSASGSGRSTGFHRRRGRRRRGGVRGFLMRADIVRLEDDHGRHGGR